MEKISEIIKKQQVGQSLQVSSKILLKKANDGHELSIYNDGLTQESIVKSIAKVKGAFPALPKEFFVILIDRVKDLGFTDKRLIDSVNNLIDNCQYPVPTLANILSFDKRVKIYSYNEMAKQVQSGAKMSSFSKVKINSKYFWVLNSEKQLYNIKDEY